MSLPKRTAAGEKQTKGNAVTGLDREKDALIAIRSVEERDPER